MGNAALFELLEYDTAFAKFVHAAIHELMTRKDPLLSRIKAVPSPQIPTIRSTMASGEIVETEPVKMPMPFRVDFNDAVKGILRTLQLQDEGRCEAFGALFANTPSVGFSTYGEAYLRHVNQTATMLAFC